MSTDFRKVKSQAVTLWKGAYEFLTSTLAEPENRLDGSVSSTIDVSASNLSLLHAPVSHDPDAKITFWMGLDSTGVYPRPVVILSNATGQSILGQAIYDDQIVDSSTLVHLIQDWHTFCFLTYNSGEYKNDYVFMRLYSYKWEHIITLTNNFTENLVIEKVAHTIGAENAHFDTDAKDPHHTLEGWIAIDLLLASDGLSAPSDYYDFVMPCPKICP